MGIPGLTGYVNSIGTLWTTIDLQNTKLVIDGSSLCYYLYVNNALDCRCGGQYDEFYNTVLSFFDALISNGVESFVIFDGANDPSDKKLDTLKARTVERIRTSDALAKSTDDRLFLLPLLSKLVFLQALRNRGIKFAFCDREADTEIASLACAWDCPVLSNDSDFFIFDIKAGYIPLTFVNWNSNRLTVSIFYRRKLASHFGIRAELIPVLASLAGNDYVSSDALAAFNLALKRLQTSSRFGRRGARFISIANMLSELPDSSTEEEALNSALQMVSPPESRAQLRQAVELSLQEYTITESNLLPYFQDGVICSSLRTQIDREIDEWVLRRFRDGHFSTKYMSSLTSGKFLLGIVVENCQEMSANRCSQWLRRFVYGILNDAASHEEKGNIAKVQEWDREGLTVRQSNVAPYQEGVVPCMSLIPYLDAKERLTSLLFALNCDATHIRFLPEKFKLIVASLRFLVSNAQPKLEVNHLVAILCCCVNLEGEWKENAVNRKRFSQPFDVRAAQSFSQWQCVLREAINLNFVLLEPVATPCIHKTYNGKLAHSLREELDQGHRLEQLIPSFGLFRLFHKLYLAVTSDLLQKMATNDRRDSKKTVKETSRSRAKTKIKLSEDETLENRFTLLCDIGAEQSEDDDTY